MIVVKKLTAHRYLGLGSSPFCDVACVSIRATYLWPLEASQSPRQWKDISENKRKFKFKHRWFKTVVSECKSIHLRWNSRNPWFLRCYIYENKIFSQFWHFVSTSSFSSVICGQTYKLYVFSENGCTRYRDSVWIEFHEDIDCLNYQWKCAA